MLASSLKQSMSIRDHDLVRSAVISSCHSFIDFNLQIPANAALFYVLCVVAAIEQRFGRSIRKHVRRPTEAPEVSA